MTGRTLDAVYRVRFSEADRRAKSAVWRVLCQHFLQKYVRPTDTVLDLGPGLGEFLCHIQCRHRIAVDLAPLDGRSLPPGTREVRTASVALATHVAADSVDLVFCSNFFEHLPSVDAFLRTLAEIRTVLKPGATLLVLQPNIKFVKGAYWDFVDHQLPLTERTLVEAAASVGLETVELIPRFLPYTTRGPLPLAPALVRLYLAVRPAWWVLGKQTLLVARKPSTPRA